MDTRVGYFLASKIVDALSGKLDESRPRLNFEIAEPPLELLVSAVSECVYGWGRSHLLMIKLVGGRLEVVIFDVADVSSKFESSLGGVVASIVDPCTLQGITFDIGGDDSNSFTLTGWGEGGVKVIERLSESFPSGVLFEGN
jgi:hypothetical protein